MNKEDYELLKEAYGKIKKISVRERKKLEQIAKKENKPFGDVALIYIKGDKKRSPRRFIQREPYIKELEHGIRTILFKSSSK
jgi:hypothetical protein